MKKFAFCEGVDDAIKGSARLPIILHWYSYKSKGHKSILPFGLSYRFGFNGLTGLTVAGVTFKFNSISENCNVLMSYKMFVSHGRLGKTSYT